MARSLEGFLVHVAALVVILGGDGVRGLQVLRPLANLTIPSPKFGLYFGAQACDRIVGPAAILHASDTLCDAGGFAFNYSSTILIVPDMVYPAEGTDCSKERMFRNIAGANVLAAVAMSIDALPSVGEFMHGAEARDPAVFNSVPLLAARAEDLRPVTDALAAGAVVELAVTCDEPNEMVPYLHAIAGVAMLAGVMQMATGVYAFLVALRAEPNLFALCRSKKKKREKKKTKRRKKTKKTATANKPLEAQRPPKAPSGTGSSGTAVKGKKRRRRGIAGKRRRKRWKKKKVRGQGQILLCFAAVLVVSGLLRVLGISSTVAGSLLLPDVSYPYKAFFSSNLQGLKFFCTVMVALFWRDMTAAMKEARPTRSPFETQRAFVAAALVVTGVPNVVLSSRSALYAAGNLSAIVVVYLSLTAAVALFFLHSVRNLLALLNNHVSRLAQSANDPSMRGVQRFALHLAKWLRLFALCTLLEVVVVVVFLGARVVNNGPGEVLAFYSATYLASFLTLFCQIKGLRGPKRITRGRARKRLAARARARSSTCDASLVANDHHLHVDSGQTEREGERQLQLGGGQAGQQVDDHVDSHVDDSGDDDLGDEDDEGGDDDDDDDGDDDDDDDDNDEDYDDDDDDDDDDDEDDDEDEDEGDDDRQSHVDEEQLEQEQHEHTAIMIDTLPTNHVASA